MPFKDHEVMRLGKTAWEYNLSAIEILGLNSGLTMSIFNAAQNKDEKAYQKQLDEWGTTLQAAVLKAIAGLG